MINQWSTIEEISCAPDSGSSGDDGGAVGGSFRYYAAWLALGAAGNFRNDQNGSSLHSLPCISTGQQVLEQYNIRQVPFLVTVLSSKDASWYFFLNFCSAYCPYCMYLTPSLLVLSTSYIRKENLMVI
jgi:hypothetical protein